MKADRKHNYVKNILFCSLFFLSNISIAQNHNIVSGAYDSTMSYYSYDTLILVSPFSYETEYLDIDLNLDDTADFQFIVTNVMARGGDHGRIILIPYNFNEVIYGRIDSVLIDSNTMAYRLVAKPFSEGEVIDNSSTFANSNTCLISWSYSGYNQYGNYSFYDWSNIGFKYLGVRMYKNGIPIFAWIKVEVNFEGWGHWLELVIDD